MLLCNENEDDLFEHLLPLDGGTGLVSPWPA